VPRAIDKRAAVDLIGWMLRRDYFLRIVEKFAQMLAQIRERIDARQFAEAGAELDRAFLELAGAGPEAVSRMSETELFARLTVNAPTNVVRDKARMLVALLQEAGRLRTVDGREEQGRACLVKALNLLLTLQLQDADFEAPQFVPTIDGLREQLGDAPLPLPTLAALWRHYERIGAYAWAEDAVFSLLETEPGNEALLAEARAFYERLLRQSDAALQAGNLPREEVKAGLAEVREWKKIEERGWQ